MALPLIVKPPSAVTSEPVTNADSSEASHVAQYAMRPHCDLPKSSRHHDSHHS